MLTQIFINKKIERIAEAVVILFGLFILIQILIKLLGGSWTIEDLILGLTLFNLGAIFTVGIMLAEFKSDNSHLNNQVKVLVNDFKSMANDFRHLDNNFKSHLKKKH